MRLKILLFYQQTSNHDECMVALDKGSADLVVLDPNEIFIAGRYHSLIPIMKEVYEREYLTGHGSLLIWP